MTKNEVLKIIEETKELCQSLVSAKNYELLERYTALITEVIKVRVKE